MSDLISKLKTMEPGPDTIRVEGWVRTKRDSKTVTFIEVNDGSCLKGLQVVADRAVIDNNLLNSIATGSSVICEGTLVASMDGDQKVDLQAPGRTLVGH